MLNYMEIGNRFMAMASDDIEAAPGEVPRPPYAHYAHYARYAHYATPCYTKLGVRQFSKVGRAPWTRPGGRWPAGRAGIGNDPPAPSPTSLSRRRA